MPGSAHRLFQRSWNSPTITTWGSFSARLGGLLLLLPLVLTRFSAEEIALYYLFSILMGLQLLTDLGFSSVFSRVFAYAMGGASVEELKDYRQAPARSTARGPNWDSIEPIWRSAWAVYKRVGLLSLALLGTAGTAALFRPISTIGEPVSAWAAWVVVLCASTITLIGSPYSTFLQGTGHVALLRRWEALTGLAGLLTALLVLWLGGGILALVLVNQAWIVLGVLRNRLLVRHCFGGRVRTFARGRLNPSVAAAVWPSAWRSGLGVVMSYGLIYASGLIYAQVGDSVSLAGYLLALRLIQTISTFSQAPFYSRLPMLARLRVEGRAELQVQSARRGMFLSHSTFVFCFILLGLSGPGLFEWMGSNAPFPARSLWILMGLAFFVERFGAMHLQLYSTTNHVVWHIANGVSGLIFLLIATLLFPHFGVYAFPAGILIAYLTFYSWYAARLSYRAFHLTFSSFEPRTSLGPVACLLIYSCYAWFNR